MEGEIKLLEEGFKLLLQTDFKEAEELFEKAFKGTGPGKGSKLYDVRPLFGILHGLTSIVKSVSSLGRTHIKESLKRVQNAEKSTHHLKDWPGRKIFKGISLVAIGGIELSQKNVVKGVLTLSKSTKHLKAVQKAGLDYNGPERAIIRSLSLLLLGILQVTYSFLSDTKGKLAKWLSGFSGNKKLGIENLKKGFQEKGAFALWCGLTYVFLHTDSNNVLGTEGEKMEEFEFCREIVDRCQEKYEPCGVVTIADINLCFLNKDVEKAEKLLTLRRDIFQLPGGKLTFFAKCAAVHLCQLRFLEAGSSFKHAMDELMKVGQRGMVPSNASLAFLCLLQVLKDIKNQEEKSKEAFLQLQVNTERSVTRLLRVFDWCMKKKNYAWGPSDKEFYGWVEQYVRFKESDMDRSARQSIRNVLARIKFDEWVLLDITDRMVFELQIVPFIKVDLLSEYLDKLEEEEEARESISREQRQKLNLLKAAILIQMNEYKGALDEIKKTSFHKKPSAGSIEHYMLLFSHILRARIHFENQRLELARSELKLIKKISTETHRYKQYLTTRRALIYERIDAEYCKTYRKIHVSKRGRVTLSYDLSDAGNQQQLAEKNNVIEWRVVGGCNSCKIEVYHKGQKRRSKKKYFENISRDTDLRSEVERTLNDLPKQGTLFFNFDNHKNILHGKTFYFKTEPQLDFHVKQHVDEPSTA